MNYKRNAQVFVACMGMLMFGIFGAIVMQLG